MANPISQAAASAVAPTGELWGRWFGRRSFYITTNGTVTWYVVGLHPDEQIYGPFDNQRKAFHFLAAKWPLTSPAVA